MARQRISLVSEEVKEIKTIESRIRAGEINAENFDQLSPEEQQEVNRVLFDIAARQVNLAQGLSAVEFVLFAFIRLTNKRVKGLALTAEERKLEEKLQAILDTHEITDEELSINNWLFDYMDYALHAAETILPNRREHIERKKRVTGRI